MPRKSFAQRIIDDIRARIESGDLKPGDQLPSYAELSATYGCSLNPVTRALDTLEALGYVEGHQGKGTFVAERQTPGR